MISPKTPHDPSPPRKLRAFKNVIKPKTTKKESSHSEDGEDTVYQDAMEEINNSPAFNPAEFLSRVQTGPESSGFSDKIIAALQETGAIFIHPKSVLKSQATRKTAGNLAKSHPYMSRKVDLDFLEAHEDLQRVLDLKDSADDKEMMERREHIDQRQNQLNELERTKQNMRVAWVTARHVQRVRVVDAIPPPPFPEDSFFEERDDCGAIEFKWGRWIGYKLLTNSHNFTAQYVDDFEELPFDFDTLRRHLERLIVVSAPLQTFLSQVRSIYRWEDPARTGRWMALYIFLWYFEHIMTFFYGYIIYATIMNYFYPTSVEELRKAIERSINRSSTAFKVGELMDKHGADNWLGPLLDEVGPFIQVQVADLANLLECVSNFLHWSDPYITICSLCLFGALFLLTAFADSRFTMKVFWFIVGNIFFVCWPISSLYPRYRLLVSPFKWALWDVPTHAEWAFKYLQERAGIARQAIISKFEDAEHVCEESPRNFPNTNNGDDAGESAEEILKLQRDMDILSFDCTYLNNPGSFIISFSGVRFESQVSKIHHSYQRFDKSFNDLLEMSKQQKRSSILSPLSTVTAGTDKLELIFRSKEGGAGMQAMSEKECAEVVLLENMRGRDKAFNAVVGFSGLRWQCLQKKPDRAKNTET